jgi:hypothetical protein
MSCQICLEKSPKMDCGHYSHIECLKEWKQFQPNYRYKCLECGKDVSYPSFSPYNIIFIILCFIVLYISINNIYTHKQYIDENIQNELLIQYDSLLFKIFSNKVEINQKIKKYCEEESELYKSFKHILYNLRYIERLRVINNSSILEKILYLFINYDSEYQDLNIFCI